MITGSEMLTGSLAHGPLAFPHCWMPNFHSIGCKMHIPLMAGRFHNNPTASNCHCHLLSHVEPSSAWGTEKLLGIHSTIPCTAKQHSYAQLPGTISSWSQTSNTQRPKVKAITVQRNFLNHCTSAQSLFQRFRPGWLGKGSTETKGNALDFDVGYVKHMHQNAYYIYIYTI